jgi:hypothetical protein
VWIEEALDRGLRLDHWLREGDHRLAGRPDRLGVLRLQPGEPSVALRHHVLDETGDHAPGELVDEPSQLEPRIPALDFVEKPAKERHRAQIVDGEEPGAEPVVDVVGVIGDVVRDGGALGFGAREGVEPEVLDRVVFENGARNAGLGIAGGGLPCPVEERPVVLDEAFEGLPSQVQAVVFGVAGLEAGDDAQRLRVVVEAPIGRHAIVKGILARVAEGGVAEVVGERERLGQVLVEA